MLEFKTAGESHGKGLITYIKGLPADIEINYEKINRKLALRQGSYGRGGRMKIESDKIEVISGIRQGKTTGSPVTFYIKNKDWQNWKEIMGARQSNNSDGEDTIEIEKDDRIKEVKKKITIPRPGHADLAGVIKYSLSDIRNISERASARETAARTAMGGLIDCFLEYFGLDVIHYLKSLGDITISEPDLRFDLLKKRVYNSPLSCYDKDKEKTIKEKMDYYRQKGDTLGGTLEIVTTPLPIGLGDHILWNDRLDGKLAQALMSIPAIKGVEIGPAFENSTLPGSEVHDEIYYNNNFHHKTNRAGGVEGGISNGNSLRLRIAMKPIPTLYQPLNSVDIETKEKVKASIERSDVTAVPAAGIVAESMVAFVLAKEILNKFGGDNVQETIKNYNNYRKDL